MKKIILFALPVLFFSFISCDSDEISAPQDFFNINEGSKWVYKRYNYDDDIPGVFTDAGITDSVEVVGTVSVNGLEFSKIRHRMTYQDNPQWNVDLAEYLRVNSDGQLISLFLSPVNFDLPISPNEQSQGYLMHPGNQTDYYFEEVRPIGLSIFETAPVTQSDIEGETYNVIPYIYTLFITDDFSRSARSEYENQTGMVRRQTIEISSGEGYEERLVSFDLN